MSVTIQGVGETEYLRLTGDIDTTLRLPYDVEQESRFFLAFSDGTLIEGDFGDEQLLAFRVAQEGAGIVRIEESSLRLDWNVEWATIAPFKAGAQAQAGNDPNQVPLPF